MLRKFTVSKDKKISLVFLEMHEGLIGCEETVLRFFTSKLFMVLFGALQKFLNNFMRFGNISDSYTFGIKLFSGCNRLKMTLLFRCKNWLHYVFSVYL
jgi:hypothetical protein